MNSHQILKLTNFHLVTGDQSFKHGCFPIYIQYLTAVLERILFSSVIMVLAFDARGCMRSLVRILPRPYISAMHLFIYFFITDFVRKNVATRDKFLIMLTLLYSFSNLYLKL